MCDYSLHGIKNRLAKEGETLIVHGFYTGSKGLTSPEYLELSRSPRSMLALLKSMFVTAPNECAVCVPDGARLKLDGISQQLREIHHLSAMETVTFRQLSASFATYRDAVEFGNGEKVRLQELEEGQRVVVLALSSEQVTAWEQRLIRADA
jgi:hypothetical protein